MENRVRINDGRGPSGRKVPINHLQVSATAIGSANTLYTVRDSVAFEVKKLAVVNTGATTTLDLHSVPSGGAAGTANTEITGLSVAANTAIDLTDLIGGLYDTGTTLEAFASVTNTLIIHGWGEEIL